MNRMVEITTRVALVAVTSVALTAAVHPEAVLKSTVTSVAVGGSVPLRGEKFEEGEAVLLVLQSAFASYDLTEVVPEEGGVFARDLTIPADVRPGEYRLGAVASDGDVVARLDLTVTAAEMPMAGESHPMDMGEGTHAAGDAMARADELPIERSRAGIEWGVIGLLIGLAGGGGLALLRS